MTISLTDQLYGAEYSLRS